MQLKFHIYKKQYCEVNTKVSKKNNNPNFGLKIIRGQVQVASFIKTVKNSKGILAVIIIVLFLWKFNFNGKFTRNFRAVNRC